MATVLQPAKQQFFRQRLLHLLLDQARHGACAIQRLKAGQREAAIREVKASLILDKIAQTEKIEVTEDDVNKEVEQLAVQMKQPVEAVRQRLTREGTLDRIRDRIRNEKTLEYLYQRSA